MALLEYKDLIGISNATDSRSIPPGYLQAAVNVDIDDSKKVHRRRGKDTLSSTGTHSMWSNSTICLCVQGGDLKEIVINLVTMTASFTTIVSGVGNTEMQYQTIADMVLFSNEEVFGYIRNHSAYAIPDIDQTFKEKMMGGQLMDFWNNRLWVFQENLLLYSDPGDRPLIMDSRHNYIPFATRGRMVRAVKDGLYVSDSEKCMFLQGGQGDPPKFLRIDITDSPCIEGSAITSDGDDIGNGMIGKVVYWWTEGGVFKGLPGGIVFEVTKGYFLTEGIAKARAMLLSRTIGKNTFSQYLVCYDFKPGYGGIKFDIKIPAIKVDGSISFGGSISQSPSASPSLSPSASMSPSLSPSSSPSLSPSNSPSLSPSVSESPSLSPSLSPSASESPSKSPSRSPSESPSVSPSVSPSLSPSEGG